MSDDERVWLGASKALEREAARLGSYKAACRFLIEHAAIDDVATRARIAIVRERGEADRRYENQPVPPGVWSIRSIDLHDHLWEAGDTKIANGQRSFELVGVEFCLPGNDAPPLLPDAGGEAALSDRTGGQGRPTSMHLVEVELRARHERGEMVGGVAAEARALAAWFRANPAFAGLTPPTAKTIENRIRGEYNRLKITP